MCDTSYFTANFYAPSGAYNPLLGPPIFYSNNITINFLGINITSNHPQTLKISLTSPQGTTLVLSAFNGNGGSNYTNCKFAYGLPASITTGTPPFTGNWMPQGGPISIFDGQNPVGIWTIAIIDTACVADTLGSAFTDSFFSGAGFDLSYFSPCNNYYSPQTGSICLGGSIDIYSFYGGSNGGATIYQPNGSFLPPGQGATALGTYSVYLVFGQPLPYNYYCTYQTTYTVTLAPPFYLGNDKVISRCIGGTINLDNLYNLSGLTSNWTLNGLPLPTSSGAVSVTGNYQLITQSAGGCRDTAEVQLTMFPVILIGADTIINQCPGTSLDLNSLYNLSGLTATWNFNGVPISNGAASAVTVPGNYQLLVRSSSSCTDTAIVTFNTNLSANLIGPDQIITKCPGEAVNLNSLFNLSGLTYSWSKNGFPISSAAASAMTSTGNFQLIVQNSSGCLDTATVTINTYTPNFLGVNKNLFHCPNIGFDLTGVYFTTGMNVNWTYNGQTVLNPNSVFANGNYTIVATDVNGCNDTAIVTLNAMVSPNLGNDQSFDFCTNTNVNLTSLFTGTYFTSNWIYNNATVSNPNSVSIAGDYYFIVSNSIGCIDTAIVTLNAAPSVTLGADQLISVCANSSVDLTALFNTTNLVTIWTKNGSIVSNPNNVTANGVYKIVAVNSNGCSDTALVTVSSNSVPNLGANLSIAICPNDVVDLTALYNTSSLTTNWLLNGSSVTNPSAVIVDGSYNLIATNVNGCIDTAVVSLVFASVPSLGSDQTFNFCPNSTFDLTSLFNTLGLTVNWTNNGSQVISPNLVDTAGTYQLIVTNSTGCTDTAQVIINNYSVPNLGSDQNQIICSGTSIDLTTLVNTAGMSTNWLLGSTPIFNYNSISTAGAYTVIATNSNGCTDDAIINLSVLPVPAIGNDQSINLCNNLSLDLTALFSTAGYNVNWTMNGNAISYPVNVNAAGNYTVIAAASNGCADTANVTLSLLTAPTLGIDQSLNVCSNLVADLTTLYNVTGYTSVWTLNGNTVPSPYIASLPGHYMLTATNADGCIDTAMVSVNQLATPSLGSDQIISACDDFTVDLTSLFSASSTNSTWSLNSAPVANPTSVNTDGAYLLVEINANGCSDSANATLAFNPSPNLGVDQQASYCSNASIDLNSLVPFTSSSIDWSLNGALILNSSNINMPGNYLAVETNSFGCIDSAIMSINENQAPELGSDSIISICPNTNVNLTTVYPSAGLNTIYTQQGIPVSNPVSINIAGTYQVTVVNASGCKDSAVATIGVLPGPNLGVDQSILVCPWTTIDLSTLYNLSGLSTTYSFNGSPITNVNAVADSGTYAIDVSDINGCADQALVEITPQECNCIADITSNAHCLQDPITFEILADSQIVSATWSFRNTNIGNLNDLSPTIRLNTTEKIQVVLNVLLSCGEVEVVKYIQLTDCADSCHIYFPIAFSPNNDGLNDDFGWIGDCEPSNFSLSVFNRYGQIIFNTTDPTIFWDGKSNGEYLLSGVYIFKATYQLPYQEEISVMDRVSIVR